MHYQQPHTTQQLRTHTSQTPHIINHNQIKHRDIPIQHRTTNSIYMQHTHTQHHHTLNNNTHTNIIYTAYTIHILISSHAQTQSVLHCMIISHICIVLSDICCCLTTQTTTSYEHMQSSQTIYI